MMNTILEFLSNYAGVLFGVIMIMMLCYVAITDDDSEHRRRKRRSVRRLGGNGP